MVTFPPCKVNLGLNIIARRPDGYHDLETCFYPVPWTDALEIIPAETFSFTGTGLQVTSAGEENLVVRAYNILKDEYNLPPVSIHLHKLIPAGAGLGGGSSDAAFALTMLNKIFNLKIDQQTLAVKAAMLGSDCPFFLDAQPSIGSGKGEVLARTTCSLSGYTIIIMKPDVSVSTAEAYRRIMPASPSRSIRDIVENEPVENWRRLLVNDFEDVILPDHPEIMKLKAQLYDAGAAYASMSGSGSAVYGLFREKTDFTPEKGLHWRGVL